MKKLTVALLSGGISSEREVSLKSGSQVFEALDKEKYNIIQYDPETDLGRLVSDAAEIDVALIILHGPYGEDGTIQGMLDLLDIPYQGTGVLGSAIAMNKLVSKECYEKAGLPVPPYIASVRYDKPADPEEYTEHLGLPLVIKPAAGGSSIGMSIVRSEEFLKEAVDKAFAYDDTVLIEAYIKGTELTCGIIGNNDDLQALPLIEIIPDEAHEFFDYEAKYVAGLTQEICPARIDESLAEKARTYAKMAHQALCCKGYSRTDMILRNQEIYVLETNTIPGMTQTSLFPRAAKAAGISFSQLLDKLIELGIEAHKQKTRCY
ncbi:D-alanine--D-alanine ligase family protein [Desulfonema magnum]|uniref:D-alanine--D-alanine ligase n=1 Tax=Desulfonema magnum TaxID=45655 RepID=A0A975BRT9_9BACT|nr:D-alanine--D-alanine ligase [Desulfonema magnum]QTA90228.1 D-alanine--D-alanine ligase [Desulfonema magnum]